MVSRLDFGLEHIGLNQELEMEDELICQCVRKYNNG
jgi:hypothetical protein